MPTAQGYPDLSLAGMIPTLYSKKLVKAFYPNTVLSMISNTDYSGEIQKYGDKVVIRLYPDGTIHDYVDGEDLQYDTPTPGTVELLINKGLYWTLDISDVQKMQSDIPYQDRWAEHFARLEAIRVETKIFADIYADVDATNVGSAAGAKSANIDLGTLAAPLHLTKTNVIDKTIEAMQCLDENNVPEEDRFVLYPPWVMALISQSDLKAAFLTGDKTSIVRKSLGLCGEIAGAVAYKSNVLASETYSAHKCTHVLFGQKSALTFATQITKKEILPNPKRFGLLMRALHVYGYETIKDVALGTMVVTPG